MARSPPFAASNRRLIRDRCRNSPPQLAGPQHGEHATAQRPYRGYRGIVGFARQSRYNWTSLLVPIVTLSHQFEESINVEEWRMPSVSLELWRTDRMLSLLEIDTQFAASLSLAPPNPRLSEENLRGYIVLLTPTSRDSAETSTLSVRRSSPRPCLSHYKSPLRHNLRPASLWIEATQTETVSSGISIGLVPQLTSVRLIQQTMLA